MRSLWRRFLFREVIHLTCIVAFVALVQRSVGTFEVEGASMEPTLRSQQYVFVDTLLLHSRPPQRGDVIVFHYPGNPTLEYVKRVVGLPRETIAVAHGRVWINGQPLREPYVREIPRYFWGPATVPADSLFVLGDNRNRSSDSHLWGPVPLRYVIGRAWLAWGPFAKWTWLGGQAPRIEAVGDERPPSARSRRS